MTVHFLYLYYYVVIHFLKKSLVQIISRRFSIRNIYSNFDKKKERYEIMYKRINFKTESNENLCRFCLLKNIQRLE